jgi:hypothetical protein
VLEDVLDEKLSPEYVRREYGVVLQPDGRAVNLDATEALRRQLAPDAERAPGR